MKLKCYNFFLILFSALTIVACKSDDSDDGIADFKAENRKGLGTSAEDLLSNDLYSKVTVELVYSTNFAPLQQTIDGLQDYLSTRLNKSTINIVRTVIDQPTGAPFDPDEIREIEEENRTLYTTEDEIVVYVFFANGNKDTDTETNFTLGTSYFNTSIVIYEKTLQDLEASGNGDLAVLEGTTIQHEFGHLFGLVNIQNDDIHPSDHEDPNASRHCVVEDCLMYFESSTPGRLARLETMVNIPTLDALCIADLQAKGGK